MQESSSSFLRHPMSSTARTNGIYRLKKADRIQYVYEKMTQFPDPPRNLKVPNHQATQPTRYFSKLSSFHLHKEIVVRGKILADIKIEKMNDFMFQLLSPLLNQTISQRSYKRINSNVFWNFWWEAAPPALSPFSGCTLKLKVWLEPPESTLK